MCFRFFLFSIMAIGTIDNLLINHNSFTICYYSFVTVTLLVTIIPTGVSLLYLNEIIWQFSRNKSSNLRLLLFLIFSSALRLVLLWLVVATLKLGNTELTDNENISLQPQYIYKVLSEQISLHQINFIEVYDKSKIIHSYLSPWCLFSLDSRPVHPTGNRSTAASRRFWRRTNHRGPSSNHWPWTDSSVCLCALKGRIHGGRKEQL